jgi:hypothetical protein
VYGQLIERKKERRLSEGTIEHNTYKLNNTRDFLASIGRTDLLPVYDVRANEIAKDGREERKH